MGLRAAQWAVAGLCQVVGQVGNEDFRQCFSIRRKHLALKGQCMPLPETVLTDKAVSANPAFLAGAFDLI